MYTSLQQLVSKAPALPKPLTNFYRLVVRLLPKLKKAAILLSVLYLLLHCRSHRKWYRGLIQTIIGVIRCRIRHIQNVLLRAYHRVEFVAKDGETCVVLWPNWCMLRSPHRHGKDVDKRVVFSESDETIIRYRRQHKSLASKSVSSNSGDAGGKSTNTNRQRHKHMPHVWIGLPGGMRPQEENMDLLYAKAAFEGSMYCVFLNPGISTSMEKRLTPSPVDVTYLLQYIEYLNAHGYVVSTIGFSIGGMQSMRLAGAVRGKVDLSFAGRKSKFAVKKKSPRIVGYSVTEDGSGNSSVSESEEEEEEDVHSDDADNNDDDQKQRTLAGENVTVSDNEDDSNNNPNEPHYMVVSCVSVHSPDRIRDIFEHLQKNWIWRFDIFFAKHLYDIHVANGSHSMLIDSGMDSESPYYPKGWFPWMNGWQYLKSITETFLNNDWHKFEDAEFDSRSFLRLPDVSDENENNEGSSGMCVIDLKQPNYSNGEEKTNHHPSSLIRATDRRQAWKQSQKERRKAKKHGIQKKENLMYQFPKVCRFFSKNDPIVPLKCIDRDCFKEIDKVVITEGGHCSSLSCPLIVQELSLWNKQCLKYLL